MTNKHLLSIAVYLGFVIMADGAWAAEAAPPNFHRPNILVILADDLGYGELGCQGNKEIPTPHIDSIAGAGIRFTSGYVSAPVCSPARAGLMTGRYGVRFGIELNPGFSHSIGLPLAEKTIAERLESLGYTTGMCGKWHLGFAPPMQPPLRGFNEFYGFLGAAHSYLSAGDTRDKANAIIRGSEPAPPFDYLTDELGREAAAFIEKHRASPWFLYLSFSAVHGPLEATEKYTSRFANIADSKRRTFAAIESAMDDAVGGVLAKLREHKLEENTLIFFLSDNGGPTATTTSSNAPLRGFKSDLLEGGIRIPFLVQWKGHLPAGKVDDRPVIALDVLPTALAATGAPASAADKLDGVNLLPYLRGEKAEPPHDTLYWRFSYRGQRAVRRGDWKLLVQGRNVSLFNLAQDLGEKNDLAGKEPEKVRELESAYNAWDALNKRPAKNAGGEADEGGNQNENSR